MLKFLRTADSYKATSIVEASPRNTRTMPLSLSLKAYNAVHASVAVSFSASQDPRALTLLHGVALRIGAISQQLLLLQLSYLLLGHAQTPTRIKQPPKNSAPSRDQSVATSRTSTSMMLVRRPTSTWLLLQVKLALTRSDPSRDAPPSNPLILLVLKLRTSTLMTMILMKEEECCKEEPGDSTKLKRRDRKRALKLNLSLVDLERTWRFKEMIS